MTDDARAASIASSNRRGHWFLKGAPGTLLGEVDSLRGKMDEASLVRLTEILVLLNLSGTDLMKRWAELDARRLNLVNRTIGTFG